MSDSIYFTRPPCGPFCKYSEVKFPKFIPIQEKKKKKSYKFPSTKIDKEARKCWLEIQKWYTDYLDEKLYREQNLKASASDSDVGKQTKQCQHKCDMKENCFEWTSRKAMITDKRFGTSNMKYLAYGSAVESDEKKISIEFYVKIIKEKQSMLRLCHLKTEMIVKCLQTFFKPYDNITILWVDELDFQVNKARKTLCKDVFNNQVTENCAHAKAILYLDRSTAKLIRHKDLCVV